MYERILKNIEIRGWKTYKSQINLMHEIECKKCGGKIVSDPQTCVFICSKCGKVCEEEKQNRKEMSSETRIAITALYLEMARRSMEVEPDCQMSDGKKGRAEEFLMNRRQLQDYVDRVFKHTLEHLGEKV